MQLTRFFRIFASKQATMKRLFLDDIRQPPGDGWHLVRSHDEFVRWVMENGVPDEVSFDHDLGDTSDPERTGYDSAKWLGRHCVENCLPLPVWRVHSANPVGRENITQAMRLAARHICI